jgi:serine/threonine-protein kinase
MLRRELVSSEDMLARFRQEVKLARRVTHRNVARTFDIGEHAGEKFLTMEYVDGESLGARVASRGALPIAEAVGLASEICAGLAAAHAAGVVHRDLKPDNVLLARDGRVVITDFGIARVVEPDARGLATVGVATGTPAYMAPEQVEGGAIDARVDLYAVGEILFEMLTGALAWSGASMVQVAAARLHRPPPNPRQLRADIPDALVAIVARAMARRPDDRHPSAAALAADLAGLTLPQVSVGPSAPSREVLVRSAGPAAARNETLPHDKTLAVLLFRNIGPTDDAYLAEGLTEDVIDGLSRVSGVRVRPFGVVQNLPERSDDPCSMGKKLDVQVVVDGSVRRMGETLRVTARLVSVNDGFQLWAARFDKPVSAFLEVGDEIADAIARALLVERKAAPREAPTDPAALELYLRARHEMKVSYREGTQRAIALLAEALRLAPRDPIILCGFAMAQVREVMFGDNSEAAESVARSIVEEAVRIAPDLPEPHLAMAAVDFSVGESESGARSLARSMSFGRPNGDAYDLLGTVVSECGPMAVAARHMELALALEPRFHHPRAELARVYELLGQPERSDALVNHAPEEVALATGFWISRTRTLAWRRDVAAAEKLLAIEGPHRIQAPARTMLEIVATGKTSVATETLLTHPIALGRRARRRTAYFSLLKAELAAYLGEFGVALDAIEHADQASSFNVTWFEQCPLLAPLRDDPRFRAANDHVAARALGVRVALGTFATPSTPAAPSAPAVPAPPSQPR